MKRFFRKLKRLTTFIPVIWKGEDYDYRYALDIFKFQLLRLADYIESQDRYVGNKNDVARIRTVCRLMDKVYDEEYAMGYFDILKEMYGDDVLEFSFVDLNETSFNDFSGKDEKLYTMKYKYESWDNAEEISQIKDELFKMSHEKQERAHRLLWQLIEKDIRKWWD